MARNANDTLSSFGFSPTTSAAPELDLTAMITSLENHRDPIQVVQGFKMDDEDEVLCNELISPVDTLDIFEMFQNDDESANDLRFSQAFGTFEKDNPDSGFGSGPTAAPTRFNDTIIQIANEIELSENPQNLNLSSSWLCNSEMAPTLSNSVRQIIKWDSNGQRCPSPDIFADSNSDNEESMKPYQIINANKGISENIKTLIDSLKVKEYVAASENVVENYSLHTIAPKSINSQSVLELNSKSNSCAVKNIVVEETTDPREHTEATKDKTSGFRSFIDDSSPTESVITLEAQILTYKSPSHAPIHRTAARPLIWSIICDNASKKSGVSLQPLSLSQKLSNTTPASEETGFIVESTQQQPSPPVPTNHTHTRPTPASSVGGVTAYDATSNDSVAIPSPGLAQANTLGEQIIFNSKEITALEQTHIDIQNSFLCQGVVKKTPLPTVSINPGLVHSSLDVPINMPEKSTSCPVIFNADCRAESSIHRADVQMIPLMNRSLHNDSDIARDVFQNDCPIEQSIIVHSLRETGPDDTIFKKPSQIIDMHASSNMDIDMELNEVDMDETFSRTFEESQVRKAMACQLPHLLNEVPNVAESHINNLSVEAGLALDNEKTNETVHNEIDMDVTFCRTFEDTQCNQAMSSQLPYLFNEMHRYADIKTVPAQVEVNSYATRPDEMLPTQSEPQTSVFEYSATQPIINTQISKDFSECFPKFASVPMKRVNLRTTGQELQDFHIAKIEQTILQVLDDLFNQKRIEFVVLKRNSMANCCFDAESQTLKRMDDEFAQMSRVFGRNRIALLLAMFAEVYRALKTRISCTKRELYYSEPELTQSQRSVDTTIKDICCILEAKPWELGVCSSSKGLLAGNIRLTLSDDDVIDCNSIAGGITLPLFTTGIKLIETDAKFVLLVEKDTVFEKLIQQEVLQKFEGHCLLVTGRGYPDINTRVFLKKLWDQHHLPIYALFDADPFGIEIMLVYRFGSIAMSYAVDELAVPAIQWIGVYPSDIKKLALPSNSMQLRDIARLKDLIKRSYISESIFTELLILQTDGRKTEIEALYSNSSPLYIIDTYLARRVKISI